MTQTRKAIIFVVIFISLISALLMAGASAGCGRWVVRETTDFLTDPVFDEAVASSTGPKSTVGAGDPADQNQSAGKEESTSGGAEASQVQAPARKETPALDLSGKWAVMLQQDSAQGPGSIALDLILIQSRDRLQGYGTISSKGSKIPATATGYVSEDAISLDVKPSGAKRDYRLDLAVVNTTLQGNYQLFESDRLSEKGNATARRSGA